MTEFMNVSAISMNNEEPYDWRVGPCFGLTWLEWAKDQIGEDWTEEVEDNNNEEPLDNDNEEPLDNDNEEPLDNDNQVEEDELVCPPTPRASHNSVKRQLFSDSSKKVHFIYTPNCITPEKVPKTTGVETPRCPDAPRKAKTRAERRAPVEFDIEQEETDNFNTPQKKERRTDYWVRQDTLRMNRARTMKSDCTEPTMSDDEPINPFN
jgi:hypothetical protein